MTSYRRFRSPGACYFFTVATADRKADTLIRYIDVFRTAFATTQRERPFYCNAAVILPDHLHMIWTLPAGDADFSTRWRLIKSRFSIATRLAVPRTASHRSKQERGIWQRRFWEHCIRDKADYITHLNYCWDNPVKHGLVEKSVDWPHSSIHRDMRGHAVPSARRGITEGDFGEP